MNLPNMTIEDSGDIRKIGSWGYCDFSKELTKGWVQIQSPTDYLLKKTEDEEYKYDFKNKKIIRVKSEIVEVVGQFEKMAKDIEGIKIRLEKLESGK